MFQVVFDGHKPEEPGDFTSVEQTVDEVTEYLKAHGIARLDAAYGCSLGGACLTRFLVLGEIPVGRAIIDGGITPYQLPYLVRKLILARDVLSFKLAANDRKVLEAAFPPEQFTIPGHDPVKEYDAMEAYKTIGKAVNMSPNTVRKYVTELIERGLIQTERTTIITQDGRKQNGSLLYTLLPIQFSIQQFYEQKLAKLDAECEQERIRKRLEAFQQAQQKNACPPA